MVFLHWGLYVYVEEVQYRGRVCLLGLCWVVWVLEAELVATNLGMVVSRGRFGFVLGFVLRRMYLPAHI